MSIQIKPQKAKNGDCIWIRFGEHKKYNIIIDSGPALFTRKFKQLVKEININPDETVDLLILTHIDNDHINGFRKCINDIHPTDIQKIWLNGDSYQYHSHQSHSPKNIGSLVKTIREKGMNLVTPILRGTIEKIGGARLTVLTPMEDDILSVAKLIAKFPSHSRKSQLSLSLDELGYQDYYTQDSSPTNKASISFIFSYKNKNIAFLGDAHAEDICKGLLEYWDGTPLDLVKLSHHGSKYNTSPELIQLMKCNEFIITKESFNDKETISRIVKYTTHAKIYSNYNWWAKTKFFTETDRKEYLSTGKLSMKKIEHEILIED